MPNVREGRRRRRRTSSPSRSTDSTVGPRTGNRRHPPQAPPGARDLSEDNRYPDIELKSQHGDARPGAHSTSAVIDPTAEVHETASIGAGARIGTGTKVGPSAVVGPECWIGEDATIEGGAVLGTAVNVERGATIGANVLVERDVTIQKLALVMATEPEDTGRNRRRTQIGAGATIGPETVVHDGAEIGRYVKLGREVEVKPEVIIEKGAEIGDRFEDRKPAGSTRARPWERTSTVDPKPICRPGRRWAAAHLDI